MDIVVISSDSSCPPSPLSHSPNHPSPLSHSPNVSPGFQPSYHSPILSPSFEPSCHSPNLSPSFQPHSPNLSPGFQPSSHSPNLSPRFQPSSHSPIDNIEELDTTLSTVKEIPQSVQVSFKRPIHTFSSSDDSDPELPSYGFKKPSPDFKKKNVGIGFCDEISDEDVYIVEETCTQGNSHNKLGETSNNMELHVDVLQKNCDSESLLLGKQPKKSRKKLSEEERQKRLKEREEKKSEKTREKALKKAASETHKAKMRGECMKYIQVMIDQKMLVEEYSGTLLSVLQAGQIQYMIQEQLSEKTITWIKSVKSYYCDDNGEIISSTDLKEENFLLIFVSSLEFIELVRSMRLRNHVQNVAEKHPGKRMILVIYKLGEYYRLQNIEIQRKFKGKVRTGSTANRNITAEQKVCRGDIENALIEIQIFEKIGHRMVESPQDLGSLVMQYTKAVAERDFKLDRQKCQEKVGWFAPGDNRDTVKVDKNGNGLSRLWKQQLCQFNNASLYTAEAIIVHYPSLKSLVQAYEKCSTEKEGQLLLQDIQIRRSAGPLTSVRRIGPELSKKIYKFFTSLDGSALLSNDS